MTLVLADSSLAIPFCYYGDCGVETIWFQVADEGGVSFSFKANCRFLTKQMDETHDGLYVTPNMKTKQAKSKLGRTC